MAMFKIQFTRNHDIEEFQSTSAKEAMRAVRYAFGYWVPHITFNGQKITIKQLLHASERPNA